MPIIDGTIRWVTLMTLVVSGMAAADNPTAAAPAEPVTEPTRHDLSDLIQPPMSGATEEQRERFAAFTEALASKSFSEAEISAKQMIDLVSASDDAASLDGAYARARALQNLAIAQQSIGNHEAAKQNYVAAVDTITSAADNLSPALIPALRGLAVVHLDTGQPQEAFAIYERATHISNVNFGPHNLSQLPIVNSKMEIFLEHGDVTSALEMLDRTYMLYSRQYAAGSEEMLPVYYQQAEVYRDLGMYYEERNALRHILSIKEKHLGENDPALIEPNFLIAKNLMRALLKDNYRSVTTSNAERHLKKALSIADSNAGVAGDDHWKIRRDCLLSLGDFYTIFDMKGRARRYYRDAWELLSASDSSLAARADDLEVPVPLARPSPNLVADFNYDPDRPDPGHDDYLDGEMAFAFTVNDRGRTEDLRLVSANPENFAEMESRLRNAVREFIYRPRYVDGEPAATPDLEYRFAYRYTPAEYQASLDKASRPRSPWQAKKP